MAAGRTNLAILATLAALALAWAGAGSGQAIAAPDSAKDSSRQAKNPGTKAAKAKTPAKHGKHADVKAGKAKSAAGQSEKSKSAATKPGKLKSTAGKTAASKPAAAKTPPGKPAVAQASAKPHAATRPTAARPAAIAAPLDLNPKHHPAGQAAGTDAFAQAGVGLRGNINGAAFRNAFRPMARPTSGPFSIASGGEASAADIDAVKRVIEAARRGRDADADDAQRTIRDPVARKLAEWAILRSDNTHSTYQRYSAFISENPSWPHIPLFNRRAEVSLWNDKADDRTIRAFFSNHAPVTAKGRLAYARALLNQGDRAAAETLAREAWRNDDLSSDVERTVIELFGQSISADDTRWRMHKRFYVNDAGAGMRAAERLGGDDLLLGRAWAAVVNGGGNARTLLAAVPASLHRDAGYIFARAVSLRKNDKADESAHLLRSAPQDAAKLVDLDQWWQERRIVVRKLLDEGHAQLAYEVARDMPSPPKDNYRAGQHFTAGWIALRYLQNPSVAAAHFAKVGEGTSNPHALGRAGYWQGRAAEALGRRNDAQAFYVQAAQYGATYYGQLARAKAGLSDLGLRQLPAFTPAERATLSQIEIGRAVEILYSLNESDLIAPIFAELGESATDLAGMAALCDLAEKHRDGRSMLLLGKAAYNRGLPLEYCAYPTFGLPDYTPVAPPVEAAVVYSIARQESHFNQKVVSPAQAMGFMQVTPIAAKDTSKRFKVTYDRGRLLSDPVYNMQMGAAELSNLLGGYRGSYILTFAGYNAGRGRVRQWIAAYGDPRDANVDPIDWAERIPLAETRNYVQRIIENLQIYRYRFGGSPQLRIEADLRRDTGN